MWDDFAFEEDEVIRRKPLAAALLMTSALGLAGAQSVHAEPLTPLTPDEIQYLEQARKVLAAAQDPMVFRGDGRLLVDGRYACDRRATNMVGSSGTFVAPALTQLAFIYLCPQ
jgi:hypothetical protein